MRIQISVNQRTSEKTEKSYLRKKDAGLIFLSHCFFSYCFFFDVTIIVIGDDKPQREFT